MPLWRPRLVPAKGYAPIPTESELVDQKPESNDEVFVSPAAVASIVAYHAEVLAGTVDDNSLYLSTDEILDLYIFERSSNRSSASSHHFSQQEIAQLDLVQLVPYPSEPSFRSSRREPLQPAPRSPGELFQRILDFINAPLHPVNPRAAVPLHSMVRYHDVFPRHHRAKTYNLLIEYAIRHTLFGSAWRLLNRMHAVGIEPNLETQKLTVRILVRVGRWNDAWKHCFHPSGPAYRWTKAYPVPFWLEFFSFTSPAIRWGRARFWKVERRPEVQTDVLQRLLQHIPDMTGLGLDNSSPRLVATLVHHLLRLEQRESALKVARAFVTNLPPTLDAGRNREAMALINLFTSFKVEESLSHVQIRAAIDELLALHPGLRPGPSMLCGLMRSLKRGDGRGESALKLLQDARSRWGTRVENPMVRRLVAKLAFKDGRRDITFTMFRQQAHTNWYRRSNDPAVGTPYLLFDEISSRDGMRQRRMPTSLLSKNIGQENTKWHSLRRAVEKKWGKKWFEEELAKDAQRRPLVVKKARRSSPFHFVHAIL